MKYVAWINTNQQYKYHHIKNLTNLQFYNFLILFFRNNKIAEFILFKKLYALFDLTNLYIYTENELIKLNKISKNIPLELSTKIFNKIPCRNINTRNIDNLLLFLKDEDKFKNKKININWGPGNCKNPIDNIRKHYNKHILSDEGKYWKLILGENGSYQKYAIDAFYKMKNVIIHSNGKNVYLSGFFNNIFIVGRYNNDIFGISSCYYVENGVKKGRYNDICFELSFDS